MNKSRRIEPVSRIAAVAVSRLHRLCFPDDPWDPPAVTEVMSIPGFFGQIACEGKIWAGFALALDLGDECELLSLGVVPQWRRTGIGAALLRSTCLLACGRGADSITLEVAVDNTAALSLYERSGFTVAGRRANYYCRAGRAVDALVLRRRLVTAVPAT